MGNLEGPTRCDNDVVKQYYSCPTTPPPTPTPTPSPSPYPTPTPTPPPDPCTDADRDGWCAEVDCDDNNPNAYPGAPIDPNTEGGEDLNCNGVDDAVDAGDPQTKRCITQHCSDCYNNGGTYCSPTGGCWTPILLDIHGDGFELTDAAKGVNFDRDSSGVRTRTAWTVANGDDAWLALDRNGNGLIDSGAELFGDKTPQPSSSDPNGFLALAEYDKPENGGNLDCLLDSRDAIFFSLRLWRDVNHNGVSESDELHTLPSLQVNSISLDYRGARRRDRHGNWFRYRAKVGDAWQAHAGRWAYDVWLLAAP